MKRGLGGDGEKEGDGGTHMGGWFTLLLGLHGSCLFLLPPICQICRKVVCVCVCI